MKEGPGMKIVAIEQINILTLISVVFETKSVIQEEFF